MSLRLNIPTSFRESPGTHPARRHVPPANSAPPRRPCAKIAHIFPGRKRLWWARRAFAGRMRFCCANQVLLDDRGFAQVCWTKEVSPFAPECRRPRPAGRSAATAADSAARWSGRFAAYHISAACRTQANGFLATTHGDGRPPGAIVARPWEAEAGLDPRLRPAPPRHDSRRLSSDRPWNSET